MTSAFALTHGYVEPSEAVLADVRTATVITDDGVRLAHSAYHLLPQVRQPTLVMSGSLDYLTPAYQSRQMARRIPGARHLRIPLGTHFVLLERPSTVVHAVREHMERIPD